MWIGVHNLSGDQCYTSVGMDPQRSLAIHRVGHDVEFDRPRTTACRSPIPPAKKTRPRNSTVAPRLGRFPSGALPNHLQCFHPIGVFSAGVDSRPVPPPTAESGAGNTEPPPGAIRPRSPPGPHSPRFCCRRCQTEPRLVLQPITWFEQRRLTAPRGTNTQNSPVPFPISIASTGPRRRGDTMGRFRVSGSHPARPQETRPSSAAP